MISYQSDEDLLFNVDFIPAGCNWFNVMVKKSEQSFDVWISEWNPINDQYQDSFHQSYETDSEAKQKAKELAESLNQIESFEDNRE